MLVSLSVGEGTSSFLMDSGSNVRVIAYLGDFSKRRWIDKKCSIGNDG